MSDRARVGDWVQVENVIMSPGERAPGLPEETQEVPLIMRVKGFALEEAEVGEKITVRTVIGRQTVGRLVAINPAYKHDFGLPVPELLEVGPETRRILREAAAEEGGSK